ncbi:hypothetical protein DPM33_22180 [Mesorhizobium hawassense]|uniref:DUF5076 domain-containing protein n=1 Tax=Mesorhizobium hawassense TaxID=1209954 RepID=A0A330HIX2_9HYPH|nr:DUF5076 domain-containing protein [Mesorhizobium hawassense]RAZ88696.1 hypothetical protein DPM33_22180 [Mesorhizobium hawassense]
MARELAVPAAVTENGEFDEILRVWIGSDAVVTMQDFFGPNAQNWGMVLADVAMHIARMRLEQDDVPEIETLHALEDGYRGRMSEQFNIQHRSLTGRN